MSLFAAVTAISGEETPATKEERRLRTAVEYLVREVPAWDRQNHCFSCHNNGDAARALFRAVQLGFKVPNSSLTTTTNWLAQPSQWENNRGDPQFRDERLAVVQFGSALLAARRAAPQVVVRPAAVREAADLVVAQQLEDGSWGVDAGGRIGSPTTYGPVLATAAASRILLAGDAERHRVAIAAADRWLLSQEPDGVFSAAAILVALSERPDLQATELAQRCWSFLRAGQASNGGWGPFANRAPEPFDTAVALLALSAWQPQDATDRIRRGRRFLFETQLPDGGWPETTRPPHDTSYAQHLSTSAWATLALLESGAHRSGTQPEP